MADGQAESFNKTLKNMIKCRLSEAESDWEELIAPSLLAYRSSVHRGTGYTPYYMLYAKEMRLPVDIGNLPESMPADAPEYLLSLGDRLAEAHSQVRQNLQRYQRKQKIIYDSRVRGPTIDVGDTVLEYSPALQPNEAAKFHNYWKGPAKVIEKISDVNFRIRHENSKKSRIVHYNNIRKVPQRPNELRAPRIKREPRRCSRLRDVAGREPQESEPDPDGGDFDEFVYVPAAVQNAVPAPLDHPPEAAAPLSPRRLRPRRQNPPVRYGNPVVY
jgi:hypothetical protein